MAESTIAATPYLGTLSAGELLTRHLSLPCDVFGPPVTGILNDSDGLFGSDDIEQSSFRCLPVSHIGSGTLRPANKGAGGVTPIGAAVPAVVFRAGGTIYFYFPEGPPRLNGATVLVANLSPAAYRVANPVCFHAGTRIATPAGERLIEALSPGDTVVDWKGIEHEILWVGGCRMDLPIGLVSEFSKWLPVRVVKDAFGKGHPSRDLVLSQQHRLLMASHWAETLFGAHDVLVPARAMLGKQVAFERHLRRVHYYHILCRSHVILLANGLPAESLFLGDITPSSPEHSAVTQAMQPFPELHRRMKRMRSEYPMLRPREGRLLAQSLV